MRHALLLTAAVLAGCSGAAPEPAASPSAAASAAPKPVLDHGWADVWTTPQPVIDTFGRLSFRPSAYAQAGDRYRAESTPPIVLADPEGAEANTLAMVAEGSAEKLDTLAFRLNLVDQATADVAKRRFVEQTQMAFRQLGVPGADSAAAAVASETPAEGQADGARWAVTRKPLTGEGRVLTVTFTSPDATGTAS